MLKAEKDADADVLSVRESVQAVLKGLGYSLIELSVSRHRGSVQIKAVIYNGKSIGTDDCSKAHRAIMPRLELTFGQNVYLEVSSPGTDRLIREKSEFAHFLGRGVRCYRTDITEWTAGILKSAGEKGIIISKNGEIVELSFDVIAKAKLDPSQEV